MSSQLKGKEQPVKREEKADFLFNQHIVRTIAYTGAGFGIGMLASLLFKHKAGMTLFFAGTGAGYGGANFINDLRVFRRNKNWLAQSQGQTQDQRRFDRKEDIRGGNPSQLKENVQQGAEDVSRFMANKVNQTAKGVDEFGRNLSDKAKEFRRGGSDGSSDQNKQGSRQREAKVFSEDKSTYGPGKSSKDKNETRNVGEQTFQSFQSNPNRTGVPLHEGVHKGKVDYQLNRLGQQERDRDNQKRQVLGLEQESGGVDSISERENIRLPTEPFDRSYDKASDVATKIVRNQIQVMGDRDRE